MAAGHKLPRGVRGHAPPEIFRNKYALRCNLVYFETIFISFFKFVHAVIIQVINRKYSTITEPAVRPAVCNTDLVASG